MTILDGAYGSNIQKGFTAEELQKLYWEAGADMVSVDYFDIDLRKPIPSPSIPSKPCFASVGPSIYSLTTQPNLRKTLRARYYNIANNVRQFTDTYLLETFSDLRNLKVAISAIVSVHPDSKIMVSIAPQEDGTILSGHSIRTVHDAVSLFPNVVAFGINCVRPALAYRFIKELTSYSILPLIFKPNLGLNREFLDEFRSIIPALSSKVNYIGACCGSIPQDIAFLKTHNLQDFTPKSFEFSGLISEKLNVNGSKLFREACLSKRYFSIYKLFDLSAKAIDINLDHPDIDRYEIFKYIVDSPALKDKWICVDSSDYRFLCWAAEYTSQPVIINSIAEEDGDLSHLIQKFQSLGTIPIVRAYLKSCKYGSAKDIPIIYRTIINNVWDSLKGPIFYDLCIKSLGMDEHSELLSNYKSVVTVVKATKGTIPLCGISNASFLFRSNKNFRTAFNEAVRQYLGLDCVIGNSLIPSQPQVDLIKDVIRDPLKLSELSLNSFDCSKVEFKTDTAQLLINQQVEALEGTELSELLSALDEVCSLYDQMKISLIQLVYAAETINKLYPPASDLQDSIAIGTVTGDVHSIGKDINISILRAMGIGMYDLGIDTPFEKVEWALQNFPIVGLSALISPSVDVIREQLGKLDEKGYTNHILIGGAATSEDFVKSLALKNLRVHYSGNPLDTYEIYKCINP